MTSTLPVYTILSWTVIDADINIPSRVPVQTVREKKRLYRQLSEMYWLSYSELTTVLGKS